MKKIKVLHVYRTYFPDTQGGLEEAIRQIALNNKDLGVESRIFALSDQPAPEPVRRSEGTVIQVKKHLEPSSCSISFTALASFRRQVEWADLVQYHFPWPFADILHFTGQVTKPTVLTYHSDIVRQRLLSLAYRPLMNRFLASMDRIVCTSANYFATSDVLSKFQDKVDVIPIGIDADDYAVRNDLSNQADIPDISTPYFLFIGVLRYYKGLHILLDAMQGAPFRVVIVGSGPTERSLKAQARDLHLDNTIFAGRLSDATKIHLLRHARGIVFPSFLRSEAFGVTLLEGAMFGKPLISTEVGSGTSHVNVHGETGIVVAPGSAKSLRRAMEKLYENEDLAEKMGRAARNRYQRLFTGELMGRRYNKLYRELLGQKNESPVVELPVARENRR